MTLKYCIEELNTVIEIMSKMMHDEEFNDFIRKKGLSSREPDYLGLDYEMWEIWASSNNLKDKLEKIKE